MGFCTKEVLYNFRDFIPKVDNDIPRVAKSE